MNTITKTSNTLRNLILGAAVLLTLGAVTSAEARDHRHRSYRSHCHTHYGYNPLYGNYAAYHGGRGPTHGYWNGYNRARYYQTRSYRSHRPTYYSRGCDSRRSVVISVGGFRFSR